MSFGTDTLGNIILGTALGGATSPISKGISLTYDIVNTVEVTADILYTLNNGISKAYVITNDIVGKVVVDRIIPYDIVEKITKFTILSYDIRKYLTDSYIISYRIDAPIQITTNNLKVILPAVSRKVLITH